MHVPDDTHSPVELYQAEWCPHSHAVRLRLTELGVDFTCRQVEAERTQREAMRARVGVVGIPTLVDEAGAVITGEEAIIEYLEERFGPGSRAEQHRAKLREERPLWTAALDREAGDPGTGA